MFEDSNIQAVSGTHPKLSLGVAVTIDERDWVALDPVHLLAGRSLEVGELRGWKRWKLVRLETGVSPCK
jgi:hypothetical protein